MFEEHVDVFRARLPPYFESSEETGNSLKPAVNGKASFVRND